jgi:hypothetical protein
MSGPQTSETGLWSHSPDWPWTEDSFASASQEQGLQARTTTHGWLFLFICFFETGSYYVAQVFLELLRSSCLHLPCAGVMVWATTPSAFDLLSEGWLWAEWKYSILHLSTCLCLPSVLIFLGYCCYHRQCWSQAAKQPCARLEWVPHIDGWLIRGADLLWWICCVSCWKARNHNLAVVLWDLHSLSL